MRRADFRDHRGLGDLDANGVIDFPLLLDHVRRLDYSGLWIFELEEPDREEALVRTEDYLHSLS